MHRNRIEQLDGIRVQGLGQASDILRKRIGLVVGLGHALHDRDAREHDGEIPERRSVRQTAQRQVIRDFHHNGCLPCRERLEQAHEVSLIDRAEHAAHGFFGQVARAVGDGLVGQ